MQIDLSPICKSLIALLASGASYTRVEIHNALPDVDWAAVNCELEMLVRATVVIEEAPVEVADALTLPRYYLSGTLAGRGTASAAPIVTDTDADVADASGPTSSGAGGPRETHRTHEDPSGVACVQITRHRNYNIGSAIRHLWCVGLRDGSSRAVREQIKAIKDARFYLDDEVERLQLTLAQGGAA
jgi:hypothetical protein